MTHKRVKGNSAVPRRTSVLVDGVIFLELVGGFRIRQQSQPVAHQMRQKTCCTVVWYVMVLTIIRISRLRGVQN